MDRYLLILEDAEALVYSWMSMFKRHEFLGKYHILCTQHVLISWKRNRCKYILNILCCNISFDHWKRFLLLWLLFTLMKIQWLSFINCLKNFTWIITSLWKFGIWTLVEAAWPSIYSLFFLGNRPLLFNCTHGTE